MALNYFERDCYQGETAAARVRQAILRFAREYPWGDGPRLVLISAEDYVLWKESEPEMTPPLSAEMDALSRAQYGEPIRLRPASPNEPATDWRAYGDWLDKAEAEAMIAWR